MTKILFTATVVKTHINAFHLPYIAWCRAQGWEVHVAAKNDYGEEECSIPGCERYFDIPFARNPFSGQNRSAYKELKRIIEENAYDIIHCNTPVAGALTRLAARGARKRGTKVIYMAHGFHFFQGAPLLNWLLYYPVERYLARYTDLLVTINREDLAAAKAFSAGRVAYVPGVGVDTARFAGEGGREEIRKELGLSSEDILLLSVGELISRKNHALVLDALCGMDESVKYAICGDGALRSFLAEKIAQKGLSSRVHMLGFRRDIAAICHGADLFVFPSLHEGLPVALMEAMAAGLPCVASAVRGNTDLIREGENGLLCPARDANAFRAALERLCGDPGLRRQMGENNREAVKAYDRSLVLPQMTALYLSCIGGKP